MNIQTILQQPIKMTSAPIIFGLCPSHRFLGWLLLTAFFWVVGCAASSPSVSVTHPAKTHSHIAKGHAVDVAVEKRLRQEYRRWQGTRHRLGGSGRRGIDCSGFVKAVYRDVFNIELPRSTRLQVRQGRAVSPENLKAGDLVFFKPPSYPRHVGVYLGGSEFVHASKNKGVTVSKIDTYYWRKYYWTARRILPSFRHPRSLKPWHSWK